ncbi:hypothetical protein PanWU01x14_310630 [Parasponia andersonii]|uniref:Uncharacterized protein n=1 Tax=Parasponia andersonii TaxID=3476 RepID=A0A2P5AQB9_PARAD|nr:hypothetical protein PanWU01x14_310630 [Parasponia andersonii]
MMILHSLADRSRVGKGRILSRKGKVMLVATGRITRRCRRINSIILGGAQAGFMEYYDQNKK